MPSRRRFLAASAATFAAAVLPKKLTAEQLGASVFTNASLGAYAQGLLTEANFSNQVGSVFTALRPDGSYGYLTLRSVQTFTLSSATKTVAAPRVLSGTQSGNSSVQVSSFMLIFDVQGDAFAQETYLPLPPTYTAPAPTLARPSFLVR
jgi:hypothetical protein